MNRPFDLPALALLGFVLQPALAAGPDLSFQGSPRHTLDIGFKSDHNTLDTEGVVTIQAAFAGQIVIVMTPELVLDLSIVDMSVSEGTSAKSTASLDGVRSASGLAPVETLATSTDPASLSDIDSTLEIQTGSMTVSNR